MLSWPMAGTGAGIGLRSSLVGSSVFRKSSTTGAGFSGSAMRMLLILRSEGAKAHKPKFESVGCRRVLASVDDSLHPMKVVER